MIRTRLVVAIATAFLAGPLCAQATGDMPDVKGKWVGKNRAIVAGNGGHWPKGGGSFAKPMIGEKEVTLDIVGQDGNSYWGITTLAGKSEKTMEPFIGQLTGPDHRRMLSADTDGYFFGQLTDNDTMSFCYTHVGGKTKSTVVSCTDLKRQR